MFFQFENQSITTFSHVFRNLGLTRAVQSLVSSHVEILDSLIVFIYYH
jgi:hypothetical protein